MRSRSIGPDPAIVLRSGCSDFTAARCVGLTVIPLRPVSESVWADNAMARGDLVPLLALHDYQGGRSQPYPRPVHRRAASSICRRSRRRRTPAVYTPKKFRPQLAPPCGPPGWRRQGALQIPGADVRSQGPDLAEPCPTWSGGLDQVISRLLKIRVGVTGLTVASRYGPADERRRAFVRNCKVKSRRDEQSCKQQGFDVSH